MCTNQDISNIPFIMRGNHFLVHGHKKDLPHITCIFHLLKYVVKTFLLLAILHYISMLRLLPKSYFKISTFQPNFLCSGSFKQYTSLIVNYLFLVNSLDTENTPEQVHECLFRMFFQLCIWFVGSIPGTWNTERNNVTLVIIIMCVTCFQSNTRNAAMRRKPGFQWFNQVLIWQE